ncbi:hypothetical protein STSO111631_01425 [Stackebrandtia soli]
MPLAGSHRIKTIAPAQDIEPTPDTGSPSCQWPTSPKAAGLSLNRRLRERPANVRPCDGVRYGTSRNSAAESEANFSFVHNIGSIFPSRHSGNWSA